MKKVIFIILFSIFTNYSLAKDLSGNAIDCYYPEDYDFYQIYNFSSVHFLDKNKAKYSLAVYRNGELTGSYGFDKFEILIKDAILEYEVTEELIILKINSDSSKNVYDPNKSGNTWESYWKRIADAGMIRISRETLFMDFVVKGFKGDTCNLVDASDPELFKKYENFLNYINNMPQKPKSKKIL